MAGRLNCICQKTRFINGNISLLEAWMMRGLPVDALSVKVEFGNASSMVVMGEKEIATERRRS